MSELGLQTTASPHGEGLQPVSPRPGMVQIEQHPDWTLLALLPMKLSVSVTLPGFKVRDLLALQAGQMIASTWPSTEDVPLKLDSVQLGWCEFETVEKKMAMRLTRLA